MVREVKNHISQVPIGAIPKQRATVEATWTWKNDTNS